MKIITVIGTRPEIIKTWSVITTAEADPDIKHVLVHAGQHYDYEMSRVFLKELNFPEPDYFLGIGSGSHGEQTAKILTKLEDVIINEKPDVVLVQGDTNTAMAAALVAVKHKVPVGHIEAGLRSFDFSMPEEINRIIIDSISSIFFAPTAIAVANLTFEGKSRDRIYNHGNTQVDVLDHIRKSGLNPPEKVSSPYAVVTLHRAENVDDTGQLTEILIGLLKIKIPIYFPVHPRTKKKITEAGLLKQIEERKDFYLIDPLGYYSFLGLINGSSLVLTDSGGIQEEAAMMGVPCVTIRETTEWPETIWSGANQLVDRNEMAIVSAAINILSRAQNQEKKYDTKNLYKGGAGERIVKTLKEWYRSGHFELQSVNMVSTGYPIPVLFRKDTQTSEDCFPGFSTLRFDEEGYFVENMDSFSFQVNKKFNPFPD